MTTANDTEPRSETRQPGQSTRGGERIKSEYLPRQAEALKLMLSGRSFEQIADEMGYADRSGAYRACMAAIQRSVNENAAEVRAIELKRLDAMLEVLWPTIIDDPNNWDTASMSTREIEVRTQRFHGAMDRALKIMERRAKYLGGLESPTQVDIKAEVTTPDQFVTYLLGAREAFDASKTGAES